MRCDAHRHAKASVVRKEVLDEGGCSAAIQSRDAGLVAKRRSATKTGRNNPMADAFPSKRLSNGFRKVKELFTGRGKHG
jgi:hypothetical protein